MLLDRLKATGCIFALFLGVFAVAAAAQAGPEDGRIVNGSGSISQSGTHTDIRQNSDFLATHWGSFNIAAHESVQAHQPDASSRLLIRVDGGGGATNIAGNYTSNGITILENQNGVQFSRGAIVNVGGLLATSSRISGVAGANWQLDGVGGAVVNHGQITAGAGGAILAAVKVQNTGDITAKGGDVALGAGSSFTVDFAGSMVGFEITKAASGASITTTGKIEAQGGIVSLSAQEAQAVRTNVVSVGGVVKATRLERRGGVVYLSGGTQGIAEVSGDVSASDKVQTTGEYVAVKEGAVLRAPEILVGGDFQGKGDVPTSRRTLVERGALLDAGAEGRVIVWSDETTWFNGDISAPGGFAEVSGKEVLASVHLAGIDVGELLLDPADIIIAATSTTTTAVTTDIAAADPGGTMTLGVDSINEFAGDLSLAATNTIMVNVAISKMTGDLTLIAGGVLTLGANITTSAGDLALTGASMALSGAATLTGALTGAAITITAPTIDIGADRALAITATGALTLDTVGMITGTGTAALSLSGDTIAGLSTALTLNVPSISVAQDAAFGATAPLTFGTAVTSLTLTTATAQTVHNAWMVASGRSLDITTSNVLTINSNINLGTGDLALTGTGGIVLGANITLNAEDISLSGAINGTNGNRSFSAIATNFLTFLDVTINTGEGDITLRAATIPGNVVSGNPAIVLTGENVELAVPQVAISSGGAIIAGGRNLEINANENIRLGMGAEAGTSLSLGGGGLILRADMDNDGTGAIINGGRSRFIMAGDVFLQQAGAFAADSLFTGNSTVTGNISFRLTTAVAVQNIYPWMASLGTGDFSLHGAGEVVLGRISLLASNIPMGFTRSAGAIDLRAGAIVLGVPLTGTSVALRASSILGMNSQPVVIHATEGDITATRINATGGVSTSLPTDLRDTPSLTLTQSDAFGSTALFTFEAAVLTSLTLETAAAAQTTHSWMAAPGRDLSLTSTGGDITIGGDIDVGTGSLTLIASRNITATGTPMLTADTVTLELTFATVFEGGDVIVTGSSFGATAPFAASSDIGTLNIITQADQTYHSWMAGTGRNLTITSVGISINSTAINLGTGDLTLNASLGVRLTNTAGLTITARDFTLFAGGLSLSRATQFGNISQFVVNAGRNITTTSISLAGARVELRADNGSITTTLSPDARTLAVILADVLLMRQSVAFPDGLISRNSSRIAMLELRTTTAVDQPIYRWMQAAVVNSPGGNIERSFSLRGEGDVVLNSITLRAAGNFGTASVDLQATTINLDAATTLTGAAISLTGAITASNNLTITAMGVLTLNSDINIGTNALTLTSGVGAIVGAGRPRLTAGMVSLAQVDAFPVTRTLRVIPGSSLAITAEAAQDVHDWMIIDGIDLTVTSSNRVRVVAIIGSGDGAGRNLGDGSITLTSTGGTVRILADITTGGNITLSGVTGGINFNSGAGAKTFSGAIVTLSGDARSDRDLALTATSGALALNGGIDTGTSALSLSGVGGITLGGALTLTGGRIMLNSVVTGAANLTITTSGTLTLNNNINLTGAVLTLALSGAGAIGDGSSTAVLTASTVRLRQVDAFGSMQSPFDFGNTGFLALTTDAAQDVHDWMILTDRNLTVTSAGNVVVRSAIGSGNRNLGTGSLTLTSTGAVVRILGGISTTGDVTITASGTLTIDSDINIGANALTLTSGAGAIVATGRPRLTAGMVSFSQVDALPVTRPFRFIPGSSLAITTEAAQDVHDWMIIANIDLTVTSSNRVRVVAIIGTGGVAGRNLGNGSITLTSTGGAVRILANISITNNITLSGGAGGINFNSGAGAKTFSGAAITLSGDVRSDRDLAITASGTLRINNSITLTGAGNLALSSDTVVRILAGDISAGGNITLSGGTNGINLNSGAAAKTLSGAAITLTGDARSNRDLALTASGTLRINNSITLAAGNLTLSSDTVVRILGGDISAGGNITLSGGTNGINFNNGAAAKTLSGVDIEITGAARSNQDLALTASGTLTLNNDIDIGTGNLTLTSGAGAIVATGRPRLTASTVSFSQVDALPVTRPFRFIPGSSLAITTEAAQDVHDWMIRENIDLTVTSSNRVRVVAIIGTGGVAGRNLGTGALSLTSTGGAVRILANISISNNITLSGVTDGINLNGTDTLSGAIITLTGDARGNRDLTLTASGVLTINNNINIGTTGTTLTLTGASLTFGSSVDLTAGAYSLSDGRTCNTGTSPSCTTITP